MYIMYNIYTSILAIIFEIFSKLLIFNKNNFPPALKKIKKDAN